MKFLLFLFLVLHVCSATEPTALDIRPPVSRTIEASFNQWLSESAAIPKGVGPVLSQTSAEIIAFGSSFAAQPFTIDFARRIGAHPALTGALVLAAFSSPYLSLRRILRHYTDPYFMHQPDNLVSHKSHSNLNAAAKILCNIPTYSIVAACHSGLTEVFGFPLAAAWTIGLFNYAGTYVFYHYSWQNILKFIQSRGWHKSIPEHPFAGGAETASHKRAIQNHLSNVTSRLKAEQDETILNQVFDVVMKEYAESAEYNTGFRSLILGKELSASDSLNTPTNTQNCGKKLAVLLAISAALMTCVYQHDLAIVKYQALFEWLGATDTLLDVSRTAMVYTGDIWRFMFLTFTTGTSFSNIYNSATDLLWNETQTVTQKLLSAGIMSLMLGYAIFRSSNLVELALQFTPATIFGYISVGAVALTTAGGSFWSIHMYGSEFGLSKKEQKKRKLIRLLSRLSDNVPDMPPPYAKKLADFIKENS